jgi:hypothetical protein
MNWWCGSSSRVPALQVQSPEFETLFPPGEFGNYKPWLLEESSHGCSKSPELRQEMVVLGGEDRKRNTASLPAPGQWRDDGGSCRWTVTQGRGQGGPLCFFLKAQLTVSAFILCRS